MSVPTPHFLLLAEARRRNEHDEWRFVLKAADGSALLEAHDVEPEERGQRLELLSVVRGLEALEQPSRVTLVTGSKYVRQGISHGLDEWRRDNWTWESFGEMAPVKNRDLWQRLDRALGFHQLEVRARRIDKPHLPEAPRPEPQRAPDPSEAATAAEAKQPIVRRRTVNRRSNVVRRMNIARLRLRRWSRRSLANLRVAAAQLGTEFLPPAWLD